MSHTARSQESKRKHFPTPPANEVVLRLLECLRSGQVEPSQLVAHVQAGDVRVSDLTTDIREV